MPRQVQPRRVVVVRYHDARGKECPKSTPGARARKTRSESYYATINRKRYPLGTDLGQAWQALRALQRRLRDEQLGIATPAQVEATRPLAGHLDDFLAYLTDKGTGKDERDLLKSQVARLADIAGWQRVGEITADTAASALAKLLRPPLSRSPQTRNHYLRRLKSFCTWLAAYPGDPPFPFPENHAARFLYGDLKRAGVPHVVTAGDGTKLYFDLHALRVWYISWAASQPGISPKTLMEMARHSDPKLTLGIYAKTLDQQKRDVIDAMPRPGGVAPPG